MIRRAAWVLITILLTLGCVSVWAETPSRVRRTLEAMRSAESSAVLVAAHRGGYKNDKADQAPENSVENINNCQRKGYDLYETDIQRTKDGHFIILHDATIDRETTGTGEARNMTLAELKRLRKKYRDGSVSSARVATFEEFLIEGRNRTVFKADLKSGVSEHFPKLIELAQKHDAFDGVVFRVPYREVPVFVRHKENGVTWPRGLVMFKVGNRKQLDDIIAKFDPTIVQIDVSRSAPSNERVLGLIRRARERKLHVQVHAEGSVDDWRQLFAAGARMFHTNDPAAVAAFRDSLKAPDRK